MNTPVGGFGGSRSPGKAPVPGEREAPGSPQRRQGARQRDVRGFRPMVLVAAVALVLAAISGAARWYASQVALPRYCQDPAAILDHLTRVLTEKNPAGAGERRPYIVAARLTFLIPRESDEPLPAYLDRLRDHIDRQCR